MFVFNSFPSPSLFPLRHFRMAYSLLPVIRNLLENSASQEVFNVISIACGTAIELATFELLARSREVRVNYLGCDINKTDLRFNMRVLQKQAPHVKQTYIHANIASSPPLADISNAHCIIWRHPEFLSDHDETPKGLILDMCQILWNILVHKNDKAPILITSYDPHEMMIILELIQQFCEEGLKYDLAIDKQPGRASWQNPTIEPEDKDPLFNLNHHDQCQLLITSCQAKKLVANEDMFLRALAKAFLTILPRVQPSEENKLADLLANLEQPNSDTLREATSFLNDQIRAKDSPFVARELLLSLLTDYYEQPNSSHHFGSGLKF